MIRVLLDTDHISLHERGHLPLRAQLVPFSPEEVAVSVVTVEEMLRGRLAILARRSDGEARVHAYTKLLETVRFFSTKYQTKSFLTPCRYAISSTFNRFSWRSLHGLRR
jgi:tRNA(fMet)-specific endonuclease VapC